MRSFELIRADDAQHAIALLAQHGAQARVLAGGTDLLVDLKSTSKGPRVIVDISRARDMRRIELMQNGLHLGALVTHSDIMRSQLVRDTLPALVAAAHTIGAAQTRNLGTLGGNLANAVPSMDSGPTLVALDALAVIAGPQGRRQLPLTEFFLGPRKTALACDELLVGIVIPRHNVGKPTQFLKFGLRNGQALALVNVAASVEIDWITHTFAAPRLALGAVAPTIIRARAAEQYLDGRPVTAEAMAEAGRFAATEAQPITDFRASAAYRRKLVAVLTQRALAGACALAEAKRQESMQ